ncbi:MAG: SdrD B-like domain-containing protein [Chloroflexota bacterium]
MKRNHAVFCIALLCVWLLLPHPASAYTLSQANMQSNMQDENPQGITVRGLTWHDADGDGRLDLVGQPVRANRGDVPAQSEEPPADDVIGGVHVEVFTELGLLVAETTSNDDGEYEIQGLEPGTYFFDFDEPEELVYTTFNVVENPNELTDSDVDPWEGQTDLFLLESGVDVEGINAGFTTEAFVNSYVWVDTNGDGLKDADEEGVSGMVVNMYNRFNEMIATAVTDETGFYEFGCVIPDEYGLEYIPPEGFEFLDAHRFGEERTPVAVAPGETDTTTGSVPLVISDDATQELSQNPAQDDPADPTAIELLSFTAALGDGHITIRWETGQEIDTFGFHLYRSTNGGREGAVRITTDLIMPEGKEGGFYSFVDNSILEGVSYIYWLHEVETNEIEGIPVVHEYGPIGVQVMQATDEIGTGGNNTFTHKLYLPMITR